MLPRTTWQIGIKVSDSKVPSEILSAFEALNYRNIFISENQTYELERLKKAFKGKNISFVLLKGANLKEIYPQPEMRSMSDVDILIKPQEYDTITEIMQELGYTFKYESDHELVWALESRLTVELHKYVVPSYNKDFFAYYGSGWEIFENTTHPLEDDFIYTFVHFAKHYRDGGAGIKYIVDLYAYLKKHTEIDMQYIVSQLKSLKLLTFYKNIMRLIDVWFNDAEGNDITDLITNYVFRSGAYGLEENKNISKGYRNIKATGFKNAKAAIVFSTLFPNLVAMQIEFPILKKVPIALPIFWIVRWFYKTNKIKSVSRKLAHADSEKVKAFEKDLKIVGLDYN